MTAPRPVLEAENRLVRFNGERDAILEVVERRVTGSYLSAAERSPDHSLEYVLNDVAYAEIQRNEASGGKKSLGRWRDLASRLGRMSEAEKRSELEKLVAHYARDIVGNFNPRVYRFANDILPPVMSVLFSPVSSLKEGLAAFESMSRRIHIEGELEAVRNACDRGTLVVTPTHSSNMDSIVLGFALRVAQLPPVTYGAGKNLFSNPFISYFMHNLGAYRVDRRLKFALYKDVLKEYSTALLERGFHSLFFPGGTRCRSNVVESHLKLGLLGTGLAAYRNNLMNGQPHRRIYVVPATINYRLVLEAETLVEDYLADTGKSRYIIEDDEFSRIGRIVEFVRKILVHEGSVVVRFGRPLDPFGNEVDDRGESIDARGREVDPATYLQGVDDAVDVDHQREAVYTRQLGSRIAAEFRSETVLLSTHLLCRALYDAVVQRTRTPDIYRLLRLPTSAVSVPQEEVWAGIERLKSEVIAHPEHGTLDDKVRTMPARDVMGDALRALSSYHSKAVVQLAGDRLQVGAMKLLYYYRNRAAHIPVEASS